MDKNIPTPGATTDVLYDQWASHLVQRLGIQKLTKAYALPSPRECEDFLKEFVASDHDRQLRFVKTYGTKWLRQAICGWREPSVPFSEFKEKMHNDFCQTRHYRRYFAYNGQTLSVTLNEKCPGFIVEIYPMDEDRVFARFSHYINNGNIPNPTEEWARTVCSVVKVLQEAGYAHF